MNRRAEALVVALFAATFPMRASASGFDIPTLYTAEHAGMGGAAVGGVEDASAVHHNPAGLAGLRGLGLTASTALFVAQSQTSPDFSGQDLSTGNRAAPVFLVAAGYRAHEFVSVGLAFYPVAAGGGRLRYPNAAEVDTINEQRLLAFELSPALSVNLPHGVSLGLGYRVTFLRYNAQRGPVGDPVLLDMALRGTNFAGVRAGAQWRVNEHWALGASYRHQITLRATGEEGTAAGQRLTGVAGEVTVPAKAVLGAHMDYGPIGVAIDVDYIFNRQYEKVTLTGDLPDQGSRLEVDLVSRWKNTVTVHGGLEGRIQRFAIRAGYAFDQAASNRAFPSTFGSPPSHGHYATAGFGYRGERWKTNVAVSHRMSADVTLDDNEIDETACGIFCASGGNYRSRLTGVLADFSYQFAL